MSEEIRALVSRHLPGYEMRSLTRLGEGLDNVAYEVNGELVVRVRRNGAESVAREAALLVALAHEIGGVPAVPEPVFADPEAGALAYRRLPGAILMRHQVADPVRLAAPLGGFLARLHRTPPERVAGLVEEDPYPVADWLVDAERDYREVAWHVPAAHRPVVEDFLGRTPPPDSPVGVLCHNDLGAEHLLVDGHTVTGVIDWGDAGLTDPARDLAMILRDLGPAPFEAAVGHYTTAGAAFDAGAHDRSVFYARCKVLEDLNHGLTGSGAAPYADAALARLPRLFPA